jgi:hypothetical protein
MATTKGEALMTASEFKDYHYEKLDAAKELGGFEKRIDSLRRLPSFKTAEDACAGSRRLLIAVQEEAWAFGENSEMVQEHRSHAIRLLETVLTLRDATLEKVRGSRNSDLRQFFHNIDVRRQKLSLVSD